MVFVKPKPNLYPVWKQIEEQLDKEFGLNQIAFLTGYSDWHFHRFFKTIQKENIKSYIKRLRLEKAAYELKITNFPILEIGMEAGFASHEAFTKAFKRVIGCTPSEFRKKHQKKISNVNLSKLDLPIGLTKFSFQKKKISSFSILYIRHIGGYDLLPGPLPNSKEMIQLTSLLKKWNELNNDHKWIGISQDDPEVTPNQKIRFDLGFTIGESHPDLPNEFGKQTILGGTYLQVRYTGVYENLPNIYNWILNHYCIASKLKLKNKPPWECYLNPFEKDPKKRITDIYIPLET
ncbi:AraC family transcriptional regulator [Leptospira bouyouniensis]|uniref:AraC family transcriptional regulator n=1 Tax=Leptospira bouyouniensis TaxID=2484911 RepID=A0A7I0HSH1_9LEPT|nr:GyrI-like domain-containing protein [Leptospira bouyouniensis]TGK52600.1 AraC family transcriptional regulator [Leptospira bouyouniensis]TGL06542.1 AraC family transcriptional regulator [Leptospira bouyouniensis]TGM85261.1 AraC family transcriptional regulator [Leptospira bouyouniensis]